MIWIPIILATLCWIYAIRLIWLIGEEKRLNRYPPGQGLRRRQNGHGGRFEDVGLDNYFLWQVGFVVLAL